MVFDSMNPIDELTELDMENMMNGGEEKEGRNQSFADHLLKLWRGRGGEELGQCGTGGEDTRGKIP